MNAFHFLVGNRAAANYEANRPKNLRPLVSDRFYIGGRYRFSMDNEHFQGLTFEERLFKLSLEKCLKNDPFLMEHLIEHIARLETERGIVGAQEQKVIGNSIPNGGTDLINPTKKSAMQQAICHPNPPGPMVPATMGAMAQQPAFDAGIMAGTNQAAPALNNAPSPSVNMMSPIVQAKLPTPPISRNNSPHSASVAATASMGKHKRPSPSSADPSSANKKKRTNNATKTPSPLAITTMIEYAHPPAPGQQIESAVATIPSQEMNQTHTMAPTQDYETLIMALNSYLHSEIAMPLDSTTGPVDFIDEFINWE